MPKLFNYIKNPKDTSFSEKHFALKAIRLNQNEIDAYRNRYQKKIENTDIAERIQFSHTSLSQFGPSSVFKLAANFDAFDNHCETENLPHTVLWAERLKEHGDLYFKLVSLNGETICSIYNHFVNLHIDSNLEQELNKSKKDQNLFAIAFWTRMGCENHSYFALSTRMETHLSFIRKCYLGEKNLSNLIPAKEEKASPYLELSADARVCFAEEIALYESIKVKPREKTINLFEHGEALQKIWQEQLDILDLYLDEISELYLSQGYHYAARIYRDLAVFFENNPNGSFHSSPTYFYQKSAEKFCAANRILSIQKINEEEKLEDFQHLKEDLLIRRILDHDLGYDSLESAKNELIAKLPSAENFDQIQSQANTKMDQALEKRKQAIDKMQKPASEFSIKKL